MRYQTDWFNDCEASSKRLLVTIMTSVSENASYPSETAVGSAQEHTGIRSALFRLCKGCWDCRDGTGTLWTGFFLSRNTDRFTGDTIEQIGCKYIYNSCTERIDTRVSAVHTIWISTVLKHQRDHVGVHGRGLAKRPVPHLKTAAGLSRCLSPLTGSYYSSQQSYLTRTLSSSPIETWMFL